MIDYLAGKKALSVKLDPIFFKLGLSDKELLVYAVIYQMTYYSASKAYTGSITYLQQFSNGTSRQGALNALGNLVKRGYITKHAADKYNRFKYKAKEPARIFEELDAGKKAVDLAGKRADVEKRLADIKANVQSKAKSRNFTPREYTNVDFAATVKKLESFSADDI